MPQPDRRSAASSSSSSARHSRQTSYTTATPSPDHYAHPNAALEGTDLLPAYVQRTDQSESVFGTAEADSWLRWNSTNTHASSFLPKNTHSSSFLQQTLAPEPTPELLDHTEADEGHNVSNDEIANDPFFRRMDMVDHDESVRGMREGQHGSSMRHPQQQVGDGQEEMDAGGPLSPTSRVARARPDSSADPLHSALAPRSQVNWSESSPRLQEINIVVLGSANVGKSVFIQKAFNLPTAPQSAISVRKMSIDGTVYVVRLVEVDFSELDLDGESKICWPDVVGSARQSMPFIDGAFTLYDVMNKESLVQVPETLSGIYNASIPFILVASKCDYPALHRHVDPVGVEKRAKALIGDITAFQTSKAQPDSQKRCVAVLLRAIVSMRNQHIALAAAARRRAHSSIVRRVSPEKSPQLHNRANSDFPRSAHRSQQQTGHEHVQSGLALTTDSKSVQPVPVFKQAPRPTVLKDAGYISEEAISHSSEDEVDATALNLAEMSHPQRTTGSTPLPVPVEVGFTFDQLVDKLLAQPMTKSDQKFAAVFLALYRKFAPPAQLLEALVDRFDVLNGQPVPALMRIAAQQRHLTILQQWTGMYPGDFAFPKTKRTLERFVSRISNDRIFAIDAKEIAADIAFVAEDDDTNWAFSDRNRNPRYDSGNGMAKGMAALSVLDEDSTNLHALTGTGSVAPSFSSAGTMLSAVDSAQRAAKLLNPSGRLSISKMQWHVLMEQPDELVARELTRMDAVLFTSIRPRDLVRYVSLSTSAKQSCRSLENVSRMIEHFNHIASWVINFTLLREKPKHRALMLEKFYRVARELRKLNNYNSLAAVVSGINNSAVYRLQATKELVPESAAKDFKRLEVLMSPQKSYAAYRLAWENTSGERIPYLPLHKRDLVSVAEGNRTFIGEDDKRKEELYADGELDVRRLRINWKKFEIMGEVIVSVQRAQGVPYKHLSPCEEVRSLVCDIAIRTDDEELYERSTAMEAAGGAKRSRFQQWLPAGIHVT